MVDAMPMASKKNDDGRKLWHQATLPPDSSPTEIIVLTVCCARPESVGENKCVRGRSVVVDREKLFPSVAEPAKLAWSIGFLPIGTREEDLTAMPVGILERTQQAGFE